MTTTRRATAAPKAAGAASFDLAPPDGAAVLARLGSLAPSLREAERKIAEFALAAPAELVHLSITELADRTETSEATVIRFAQRLGYAGYAAFKIALALDLRAGAAGPAGVATDLDAGSDIATITHAVIQKSIESLNDTAQLLDHDAIGRAVEALIGARRIEVYGVGGSAAAALDAYGALLRVGLPIAAVTDPHHQIMSAVQLRPGDVALAMSQSGSTRDTVEALRLAREAGATCLCITRHARSPITQVAHVTLLAAVHMSAPASVLNFSRVSQLAVIDILATAAALARRDSAQVLARWRQAIGASKKF